MQISSRFTLAIHIFACVDTFKDDYKVTSDFIAGSTNVNPVIIRKILGQLKAAGLIEVARGTGGTTIAKPLSEITFLDIYRAVECVEENQLFHFHENPNTACPVGRNIHHVLDEKLDRVQKAMERELQSITLEDVREDLKKYLGQENPEIEISVSSPEYAWIRLHGKVVFENNMEVKEGCMANPIVKGQYQTADNPIFEVFYLENAHGLIADFSGNAPYEF